MNPLNGNIAIELIRKENSNKDAISFSKEDDKSLESAIVINNGGCDVVKNGDKIIFKDYSLTSIEIHNKAAQPGLSTEIRHKTYHFIKEEDIIASYE